MTPAQFRSTIATLGLSQEAAAVFMGRSPRTGQSWALGERDIPVSVAKLLRLMIKLNLKPEDVK